MGMITCTNCGKDTFDDEKCVYCNHPLKKRENLFDTEKYQYIKAEYLKTNNKAAAIKSGMNRFSISMQEAKEIADLAADEVYEESNIRSKEQVANLLDENELGQPKRKDCYKFSFIAYFIHVFLYQLIAEAVLVWGIMFCRDHGIIKEYPLVFLAWGILELLLLMNILLKWGDTCTIYFSTEPGNYIYGYNVYKVRKGHRNGKHTNRIHGVYYQIRTITKIEEHMHSFVIYGTILKGGGPRKYKVSSVSGNQIRLDKIKVPKCFHKNKELLGKLKQMGK